MTLYERVNRFIEKENKAPVSDEIRMEIGKKVVEAFREMKHPNVRVLHRVFGEKKGSKKSVVDYPLWFVRVMDAILRQHLENHPEAVPEPPATSPIPERKPRRRIPAKIQY